MPGLGSTGGSKFQLSYGWREARATDSFYRFHVNHSFTHNWQPSLRQSVMDLTAIYALTNRISVQASLPIVNNRFSTLFPPQGPGIGKRFGWNANDIGDTTLYAQRWMLPPKEHPFGNFALGLGMKIPTGEWGLTGLIPNETGVGATRRAVFPPSMMPGDGGTGIIFGISGFKNIRSDGWMRGNTVFGSASYLANPRNQNNTASIVQNLGVPLAPQFQYDLTNSVTDSYMVQVGTSLKIPGTWDKPRWKGLRGRITLDWQGIPTHDLIGGSSGYRQPGYIMAIAPGITYSHGHGYFIAEVPLTFNKFANGQRSAIPGLPVATAQGLEPAPFTPTRNLFMVAPVGISLRYVRSF